MKADLTSLTHSLSLRFQPAASHKEATHQFSTNEIRIALTQISPALDFTSDEVFEAMISAGYIYAPKQGTSSLVFAWLLVEK